VGRVRVRVLLEGKFDEVDVKIQLFLTSEQVGESRLEWS
jgi:hypothetical protein